MASRGRNFKQWSPPSLTFCLEGRVVKRTRRACAARVTVVRKYVFVGPPRYNRALYCLLRPGSLALCILKAQEGTTEACIDSRMLSTSVARLYASSLRAQPIKYRACVVRRRFALFITLGAHAQRGYSSWVVCLCLSVTLHLTSRVFFRLTKDTTYQATKVRNFERFSLKLLCCKASARKSQYANTQRAYRGLIDRVLSEAPEVATQGVYRLSHAI